MHVCFLFHRKFPQNNSTVMNELPRLLVEEGVDVSVVCARDDETQPARETTDGVDVYRITSDTSTSVSPEPTRFGYAGLKTVSEICRRESVDVLHMVAFPNLGLVLDSVPWLEAPPVTVVDVRGTAVSNAVFEYVSQLGINLQSRLTDHTIVLEERVAEKVLTDPSAASIVPLGANFDNFYPGDSPALREQWGVDDDEIVFGYTGNIHPSRRLQRLIDAFAAVNETHPKARLVLVGDGPDFEKVADYAASMDLDNVILTGGVPFTDVPDYVRAFDVGLAYVPDRPQYRDQPPLKTVEFLASGLPVVGTNTPGNRRFLEDGHNGRLVADNVDTYREAIAEVMEDWETYLTFANRARESVREFSYERIVREKLLPVYSDLLD